MDTSSFTTGHLMAIAAALGWASGLRLYGVVFLTGLAGSLGWVNLPAGLAHCRSDWRLPARPGGPMSRRAMCCPGAKVSVGARVVWHRAITAHRPGAAARLATATAPAPSSR